MGIDPRDHGNLDTRLEPCRRPAPNLVETWQRITSLPGVERVVKHDGRVSLRVRGIEFAELRGGELLFGLAGRRPAREHHIGEIERLVEELDRARSAEAEDRGHPLYRQSPEAWLESQARAQIETLDASLVCDPIYGQVPAFAGGERGILDLLAADHSGRLAVVELKASADLHLPLQALDYWIRVKWHLDRGEFTSHGYFPGVAAAARAAAAAAGLAVARISSQLGDDTELLRAGDRSGAGRAGGGMAEGVAGDVPAAGGGAAGVRGAGKAG